MLFTQKIKSFLPTVKPALAKAFYNSTLGLTLLSEDKYALEFEANGTALRITTVEKFEPHPFTVLGWDVNDVATFIKSLQKKGIVFERYSFIKQDDLGIWTSTSGAKVAWFKDPDGNLLSLTEHPSET